jgi:uncharacterized protein YdaU (DUF1376 family)
MSADSSAIDVSIYMSIHLGDRVRETGDLSPAEYGAHVRLTEASWMRGGYLPAEAARLCRLAGAAPGDWPTIWAAITHLWTVAEDGRIFHGATLAGIERARAARASLSERGRKGREAQLSGGKPSTAQPNAGNGPATVQPDAGHPVSEIRDPESEDRKSKTENQVVGAEASATGRSAPAPAGVSLLEFSTRGKTRTWSFTEPHLAQLHEAFPDLDIVATVKKAKAWIASNPARTPTAKGMSSFLYRWIAREQDGRPGKANTTAPARDPRYGRAAAEDYKHDGKTGEIPL